MLSGWYILVDDEPKSVDLEIYMRWLDDPHKKVIARTYLSRDGLEVLPGKDILREPRQMYACVSTVFLGMDVDYLWQTPDARPTVFETMLFARGEGFLAPQWRYTSTAEARATHTRIVAYAQRRLRVGSSLCDEVEDWPE